MATEAQVSKALAWETGQKAPPDKSVWEWLWEAIQGDFNDNRSTGQIAFDAGISMIPVIDQICDVRDIIANCKGIAQSEEKDDNTWKWVALVLTLIGLFPSLGSLVKGVLKIFFAFIRRYGLSHVMKAVDEGLTWVVTFLRKPEVQKELRRLKVDEVFGWLAKQIKTVRSKVNIKELLAAFDKGIKVMKGLLNKVTYLPGGIGKKAQAAIDLVEKVRKQADEKLGQALVPVQKILDNIIQKLEREALESKHGILNANNIHFRGALPEDAAVKLMRTTRPRPSWLSDGLNGKYAPLLPKKERLKVDPMVKKGYPPLTDTNIASFHKLVAHEIKGPARLYRVLAPNSRAMSDCWVTEEVFKQLNGAANPRAAWRKHLAVWPDWNVNGQFVVYDVKPGETLKTWRGAASSQTKGTLPDAHLEGGWEQIVFNVPRTSSLNDTVRYYKKGGGHGTRLEKPLSQAEFDKLPGADKAKYLGIREKVNHPNISGPFETGWGYFDDFANAAMPGKIGLPSLPGQSTQLIK